MGAEEHESYAAQEAMKLTNPRPAAAPILRPGCQDDANQH